MNHSFTRTKPVYPERYLSFTHVWLTMCVRPPMGEGMPSPACQSGLLSQARFMASHPASSTTSHYVRPLGYAA